MARTAHSGANGVTLTTAFYHADGNGNVTYLLKLDQTAGATYQFDPYGRLLASSGTLAAANTYRFSSKEVMLASGFYSFGYRFYDPATQRWLNRDPIGEEGGVNLYGYVENDPVNGIDPLGLSSIHVQVAVAIAKGDLVALESLLATGMLSPAAAARVQEAINRLNSPAVQSGLDKACKVASRATKVTKSGVPSLRQGYADAVSQLRDIGNSLRAAGVDSEQIARAMHADRRAIGEQFKALTPPDKLAEISARNFNKYGDNLGPTVDWLRSQGKSWDDIIESAGRIGGKDLGF